VKGIIPVEELSGKIFSYSKGEEIKAEVISYDERMESIILSESRAVLKEMSNKKSGFSLSSLLDSIGSSSKEK
jgi:hypothetical protein